MKYDFNYFHNALMLHQNMNYEAYRNKKEFDILLQQLNTEEIYDYNEVNWCIFRKYIVNYVDLPFDVIAADDRIEQVCNQIVSREVRIKLLLYLQKNANCIFEGDAGGIKFIEQTCAKLISKNITESSRDQYHGLFADMPRPNYEQMLLSDDLFSVKSPSGQWADNHATEKKTSLEEKLANRRQEEIEVLFQFIDACADSSNVCPNNIVLKEAFEQYNNYKSSSDTPSDIWKYISQISKKLEEQTGISYWRQTPAYQVIAVVHILLKTQESPTILDNSFASSIEKVICHRPNFVCTQEMLDTAIIRINENRRKYTSKEVMTQTVKQDTTNDLPDLKTFIVSLIEVATEELEKSRREALYIFLTDVLEPYRNNMPKEIFTALEKVKKGKPVDTEQLKLEIGKLSIGHVAGDLVMEKNIANNVENVAPNAIGIDANKKK